MSNVFLSGSRNLHQLDTSVCARLKNIIVGEHTVLIGDAAGADKAVQGFFSDHGYQDVVIYCMDGKCRNNIGHWKVHSVDSGGKKKGFQYFAIKDAEMSRDADHAFMLWDGKSKGTLNNALNMLQQKKIALIYFTPTKSFISVKSTADIKELVTRCDSSAISYFDKTINFSERIQPQQDALDFAWH